MSGLYESGTFEVSFDGDENFTMDISGDDSFNADMGEVIEVQVSDHRQLTYRDANNQHPISAVTDLVDELNERPSEVISDSFINLLN